MFSLNKKQDYIIGIVLIILGVLMFQESTNIKSIAAGLTVVVGSDFLPKIAAVLMSVFGLAFIIKERVGSKLFSGSQDKVSEPEKSRIAAICISLGLLIVYVYMMTRIGFMISTVLYLFVQITVLSPKEKRKYLLFAIISIISSVLIYFAFVNIFSLMLPRGKLF